MRTFRKLKSFGTTSAGMTGGKNNEAVMFICGGSATTITIQSLEPNGNIVSVGPLTLAANQSFIYPAFVYGWTAGASVTAYELF
jgi:hypothetical protein